MLVNNAGVYPTEGLFQVSEETFLEALEINTVGAFRTCKAFVPGMVERGYGHVVNVSSGGGSFGGQVAYPGFGAYCATKFALEGFSEALAPEVAPFGIKVLIVEPGAFRTGFSGGALVQSKEMPEYAETVGPTREMITGINGTQPGDPAKAAQAILTALDSENTPLRLPLGADAVEGIRRKLDSVRAELDRRESVAVSTAFEETHG